MSALLLVRLAVSDMPVDTAYQDPPFPEPQPATSPLPTKSVAISRSSETQSLLTPSAELGATDPVAKTSEVGETRPIVESCEVVATYPFVKTSEVGETRPIV
jgi:hypothetical protein